MALASSSKVQVAFKEESTPGVVAAGAPRLLRNTDSSGLSYNVSRATSAEVNATRQTPDSTIVDAEVSGPINIEALYREFDAFYEALVAGTFSTAFGTDGVESMILDFDAVGNTITDSNTGGSFVGWDNIVAGQWIMIKDAGSNTGLYRVATKNSTVATIDAATPVAATVVGDACTVSTARLTNGTAALRTFSIEKHFTDITQFFIYRGCGVSSLQLNFTTGSILNGAFTFMGFNSARAAVTHFTAPPAAATTFGVMNSVTGVGNILVDGSILSGTYVQAATINLNAALRGQKALSNLGNVGLGEGTFEMGGNLTIYLADGTLYDTALADTAISLAFPVLDVNNNGYVYIFDNVKLAVPQLQPGAKDQDVMLSLGFTAHAPDTSTDKMIKIDRVGDAL